MNDSHWKTHDMTLVAFLRLGGHVPINVQWLQEGDGGGNCYWWFHYSQDLRALRDLFFRGDAKVEPRVYNRMFAQTRTEMHNARNEFHMRKGLM